MRRSLLFLIIVVLLVQEVSSATISEIKEMIESQKYPEAFSAIEERLEVDPKNHFLYEYNGDIYFYLTEYRKAIDSYRKALINSVKKEDIDRILDKVQRCKEGMYLDSVSNLLKSKEYKIIKVKLTPTENISSGEVVVFDSEFGFKRYGRRLFGPVTFAVNSKSLYVMDNINFKIKQFDHDGNLIKEFGNQSRAAGGIYRPVDMAADDNGNVYVLDMHSRNLRLIKFNEKGSFVKEVKILDIRQLNRIRAYEDILVVECVKGKQRVFYEYDHDLVFKGERDSFFKYSDDEYHLENIFYNVLVINNKKLKKEFKIDYIENTVSKDLLYVDNENFYVVARRITGKKEKGRYYLLDIYQISKDGKVRNSVSFSPELMGNIFRTRKYYFSPDSGILYVSVINDGEFKLLKFKVF